MVVKMKDQRFNGHRITKSIKFKAPLNIRERTEFELTYYNEGTEKNRTEKMARTPNYVGESEDFVILYISVGNKKLHFNVGKEYVTDKI